MEAQDGDTPTATDDGGMSADLRARSVASLFRNHNRALVNFLTLRLQSVQEAREVAQEAYVRLLQLDRPAAHSFLQAYLFRVASNLAIDRLRRRGAEMRATAHAELFDEFDDLQEPERAAMASQQLDLVRRCLEELPENCRHAFVMHRIEGLGIDDIAARLKVSSRMIYMYLERAMIYCRLRTDGATAEEARQRMKQ